MSQNLKLKTIVFILLACVFCLSGTQDAGAATKKIGILLWAKDLRNLKTLEGFMAELREEGFKPPEIEVMIKSADANRARAMKISQKFSAMKMDLYVGIGTSPALALKKEISDRPIVFALVYDPVATGVVESWQSPGNNVTGSSNYIFIGDVIDVVKKVVPLKSLAVIYSPGDKNAEEQLKQVKENSFSEGVRVVPVSIASQDEAFTVLRYFKGRVEAVYLSGSVVVENAIPLIVEEAKKDHILTVSHLLDYTGKGVLLGVGKDLGHVGRTAGHQAAMILNGANPKNIPIGKQKDTEIFINMTTARACGINIPDEVRRSAEKLIEQQPRREGHKSAQ
ncbi:MAG: ABC transporter substrate-binding protein [Candidatus Omnitrophica bacterium]|nr:ABC transporter substrate-binding protein [Candidatus Omnitrophota bacterium]